MTGLRTLQPEDIMAIKNDIVEDRPMWKELTLDTINELLKTTVYSFTYVKDDKVVACCGSFYLTDSWEAWAIYSGRHSALTRVRAVVEFCKKLKHLWITEHAGTKACFSIPSDLKNGKKYAKLLGGKFLRIEKSLLFEGITNNIYEVI